MAGKLPSNDSEDFDAIAEINVTPFVDVVLVLLVIFMVTAPMIMKPSINVNLPKAASGDAAALDIWRQFGFHLGKLLQALLFTYDPQAVIIGGGITAAAPYFEISMRQSVLDGFPYQRSAQRVQIFFSMLEGCNMLGASRLNEE